MLIVTEATRMVLGYEIEEWLMCRMRSSTRSPNEVRVVCPRSTNYGRTNVQNVSTKSRQEVQALETSLPALNMSRYVPIFVDRSKPLYWKETGIYSHGEETTTFL